MRLRALAAAGLLAACASPPLPTAPPPEAPPPAARAETSRLRDARAALARGELEAARAGFAAALAAEPADVDALLGLAAVEQALDRPAAARAHLERAVERAPERSDAHARLAALTGRGPDTPPRSVEDALARAEAHPYDTRALLAAAVALARVGEGAVAVAYLERVAWLGDRDPPATTAALRLLSRLDPAWRRRRVVPVYAWADAEARARPGWRFQLRTLWLATSNTLDPVLGVRFVPYALEAFDSGGSGPRLEEIHTAFWDGLGAVPERGLLAAFTGRAAPQRPGAWQDGIAEFAGRRATVRLAAGAVQSRTLAHEVLHLYGGVHLAPEIESLMNPAGESLRLDAYNTRIVRALRQRVFEAGDVGRTLLPWIDLGETVEAYSAALAANLTIRRLGLEEAARGAQLSRFQAAVEAGEATALDPHLADVLRLLATFQVADGRRAEAVSLLEAASRLYGPATPRGREARAQAAGLRAEGEERVAP